MREVLGLSRTLATRRGRLTSLSRRSWPQIAQRSGSLKTFLASSAGFLSRTYASSGELRRTLLQCLGGVAVLYGIGLIFKPAAWIIGGLLVAVILEVRR